MLTRRHIRIKIMQSVYALKKDPAQSLKALTKNYHQQMLATYDLYFVMLALLRTLYQRHQEQFQIKNEQVFREITEVEKSQHIINNQIFKMLLEHKMLTFQIEKRKIKHWDLHFDYVDQLLNNLEDRGFYKVYMEAASHDWKSDMTFVLNLYREVIAPHDALFDYLEDQQIGWNDDFSVVNTFITKQLKKLRANDPASLQFPLMSQHEEDISFGISLLETTVANGDILEKEIQENTPNWESDRIAQLDLILLQLGIAELLYFESIPTKVTLNEYLEIAKDYSTPKSNIFINGVLDKLAKEFLQTNRMKKTGRGLRD